MDVKIGIENVVRELHIETDLTRDEVLALLNSAVKDNAVFTLVDNKGQSVAIPAVKIAYLQLGAESGRKVGFGLGG
ncbi:MAG: DUF3107 domain-containing protein [Aeromicrobium sp.]|nr:MAG: DUF3107 domain-containing protein [Aeromicrobium sp.]